VRRFGQLHPGRFQTFGNEFEQAFHRRVADLRVTDQFLEFAANPVKIQNLQPWRGRTERDRSSNGRVGQKRRSLPGNFAARRSLGIRASPLGYTVCNPRSNMRSICIVLFAFTVSASHLGAEPFISDRRHRRFIVDFFRETRPPL
jgi:hypothetical protein